MDINQRNVTRNQSTVDYSTSKLFIWDNHYKEGFFYNSTGAAVDHKRGQLVTRDAQGRFIPATVDTLADIVGVSACEGTVSVAATSSIPINICTKGTIDGNLLVLPATVTLNTVVDGKLLTDIIESLGIHVDTSSVQHTKFDN